jgi:hypothetical protein
LFLSRYSIAVLQACTAHFRANVLEDESVSVVLEEDWVDNGNTVLLWNRLRKELQWHKKRVNYELHDDWIDSQ